MLSPVMLRFSLASLVLIAFFCRLELAHCQYIPIPEIKNCLQPADHCVGQFYIRECDYDDDPGANCVPPAETESEYEYDDGEKVGTDDEEGEEGEDDRGAFLLGSKWGEMKSSLDSETKITSVKKKREVELGEEKTGPSPTKRDDEEAAKDSPNRHRRSSDDSGKGKCDIPSRRTESKEKGASWINPCLMDLWNQNFKSKGFQHKAKIGDSCDPLLFRAFRRVQDDARDLREAFSSKYIDDFNLGDTVYRGACKYLCPSMMCMSIGKREIDTGGGTFLYENYEVDMVTYDCVTAENGPISSKGVCTCGNLMGRVDPSNLNASKFADKNGNYYEVTYDAVGGLDRRLVWNETNQVCAADHFGHCSLDGEDGAVHTVKTGCHYPTDTCVNETVFDNNLAYFPLKTEVGGRWFGVCAVKEKDKNPWAGASRLGGITCPTLIFMAGLAALAQL